MKKDPFREPWTARRVAGVAALLAFALALAVLTIGSAYYPALSPPRKIDGIVASAGPLPAGRTAGGMREAASVRLVDGRTVLAYVDRGSGLPQGEAITLPGGALAAGEAVTVLEQRRLLAPPTYEVVARR